MKSFAKNSHQKDGLSTEKVALISREGGSVLAIKWYYWGEIFNAQVAVLKLPLFTQLGL